MMLFVVVVLKDIYMYRTQCILIVPISIQDVHVGRAIDYNYRYCIKVPYLSVLTFTLQQTELTAMCMMLFMTVFCLFLRQWMWVWSGSGSWFFFPVVICVFMFCVVLWFVLRLVLQFVRECTVLKVNC